MAIEIEENPAPGSYPLLTGNLFALDAWCRFLRPPFDPAAIRLVKGETVLISTELRSLADADEIRERTLAIINRLNGALRLFDGIPPLQLEGMVEIASDGQLNRIKEAEVVEAVHLGGIVDAELLGPDGKPKLQPPTRTSPQIWNALAQSNELISEMLDHVGRADNWYEIFKAIECCEDLTGDGEKGLLALMGDRASEVKNLKSTANSYRHASRRASPRHYNLTDGKALLSTIAVTVLTELAARGS